MNDRPFPSFPNFTWNMYDGNSPCGKGHTYINPDTGEATESDRWQTKYGNGESIGDEIKLASFNINANDSIFICGNHLSVINIRMSKNGNYAITYEYINDRALEETHSHKMLEREKAEKCINKKYKDCKFWDLVQTKAKELFYE